MSSSRLSIYGRLEEVGGIRRLFDRHAYDFWAASLVTCIYIVFLHFILVPSGKIEYLVAQINAYGMIPFFALGLGFFVILGRSYARVNSFRKSLSEKSSFKKLLRKGDFIIRLEFYHDWCKVSILISTIVFVVFLLISLILVTLTNAKEGFTYSLYIFSSVLFCFTYASVNYYHVLDMDSNLDSIESEYT